MRTRLVLAFGLLCVVTAVAVAVASYRQARLVILQQTQDTVVTALTNRIRTLYPLRMLPPDQGELDGIAESLSDRDNTAMAVYHRLRSVPALAPGTVSAELRDVVGNGIVAWQRVTSRGEPSLVVGTQLRIEAAGSSRPSGIEVYDQVSLLPQQRSIAVLARNALLAGGVALALAVGLALLAAQGVLRPVRQLGRAAQRLGAGDLTRGSPCTARTSWRRWPARSTRLPPNWSSTWRTCGRWRPTRDGSSPTSRTSCARRWRR